MTPQWAQCLMSYLTLKCVASHYCRPIGFPCIRRRVPKPVPNCALCSEEVLVRFSPGLRGRNWKLTMACVATVCVESSSVEIGSHNIRRIYKQWIVSLIPQVVWSHTQNGTTYMDLTHRLPPLSSGTRYACLEFLFIEESVKMMQKGEKRGTSSNDEASTVCFGCPLLVGFQENAFDRLTPTSGF